MSAKAVGAGARGHLFVGRTVDLMKPAKVNTCVEYIWASTQQNLS